MEEAPPVAAGGPDGSPTEPGARVGLALVVVAVAATLTVGYLIKRPCVYGPWDGRQYGRVPCYTDIIPLWYTEQLDAGRIPYIEAQNEYPVLTGMAMEAAAWPARDPVGFFHGTAILLGAAAIGTVVVLWRLVGARALYVAVAPTLAIYGFMNWDLLAVFLATLATAAYVRQRDGPAGVYAGLGAAAKLYPGLLAVPFAIGRAREGKRKRAVRVAAFAVGAWILVNAPFAIVSPSRWWQFFSFNGRRGADWDSVWFLLQDRFHFEWPVALLNLLSLGVFVAVALILWNLKSSREPGFPAWSFGFPLIVAFLLTNKVYSPQYSLWLLPWFALTLPNRRLFVAFEVADAAVFITRFRFFALLEPAVSGGLPFGAFVAAILIRAAILVACLVVWVRRESDRLAERSASAQTDRIAPAAGTVRPVAEGAT